jgi:hypothetical protein
VTHQTLAIALGLWGALAPISGCLDPTSGGVADASVADTPDATDGADTVGDSAVATSCEPAATRCADGWVERCAVDGAAWAPVEDCGAAERCYDGACVVAACHGGDLYCAGERAVYCVPDGTRVAASADCGAWGRACVDGRCLPRVCTPGAISCDGDTVATCDADGTALTGSVCDGGEVCVADDAGASCVSNGCVPGAVTCAGDDLATCVAPGQPLAITPCGANQRCVGGTCEPAPACEAPEIVLLETRPVAAQTLVHLTTARAYIEYDWRVVAVPGGAPPPLAPSAAAAVVALEVDVVGTYRVAVDVYDPQGQVCGSAEVAIAVVADAPVHVELLWDTPLDPDQGDVGPGVGGDLDLHVVTPLELAGPQGVALVDHLFDAPWDTYWFNAAPNSGPLDPALNDDPSLDRDDADGAGPENTNIGFPHDDATYLVAAHYWTDNGYGASTATLRVYIYGALAFEASRLMVKHDLWPAATIAWPSGEVRAVGACSDSGALCDDTGACGAGATCDAVTWPDFADPLFPPP